MNVGVYPGVEPRLLLTGGVREDLAAYRAAGGYGPGLEGEDLIEATDLAELRGRGGAGFPMGVKLRSIIDRPAPRFGVANGEEGEPAAFKDRWLLRMRPHLVLDGLLRSCLATGVEEAFVYVSDPESEASILDALAELDGTAIPISVVKVEPAYVAGEATSVVRAINGGPAKPTDKPPLPFDKGVRDSTTLISNVETLANMPFIAMHGAEEYRRLGEGHSLGTGTLLMTISGAVERPGLYEVPFGGALRETIDTVAGVEPGVRGYVMGGFFAGLSNTRADLFSLSYAEMRAEGSGLGCAAIVVLGENDCPVGAAADITEYLARENAQQCGACINGTPAMARVIKALSVGEASDDDLDRLDRWSHTLRGRGACGLLDAVCNMAASLKRDFGDEMEAHRDSGCERCRADAAAEQGLLPTRFALSWDRFFGQVMER